MFFVGILIGGALVAYMMLSIDKKKIKCDRVPYGLVDETLKGDDKIDAIQANLDNILNGNSGYFGGT